MRNSGQLWALVLAAEETEREAGQLLDSVVNRAVRTAHRERVLAVVTQQHRRHLKGPLWFLPASNFVVLPDGRDETYGIVMGLLRILERDPAARVVLVPGPDAHDLDSACSLAGSARTLLRQIEERVPDITARVEWVPSPFSPSGSYQELLS